jgi:hypothetical protein
VQSAALALTVLLVSGMAVQDGGERFGALQFPRDEHVHPDGWDFWWGAADLVTPTGNRYTVAIAPMTSLNGVGISAFEVYPRQGPYAGRTVATSYGPEEWGHPAEPPGRFVRKMSAYVPGVSERLRLETVDTSAGGKIVGLYERTSPLRYWYRAVVDDDAARVHPGGATVRLGVELSVDMLSRPLLAEGDGRFFYGVPQSFGYPSRSFQYMQAAETLSGTLELGQPDGTVLYETVDPKQSSLVMIHEYDATPEDIPAGLALALADEMHPRFPLYYQGGMPWELFFVDLRNGAQLMLGIVTFQDSENGTLHPVIGRGVRRDRVFATVRLPTGESIALDDRVRVEHLSYRRTIGKVPTFMTFTTGIWDQAWTLRIRFAGDDAVPAFDIGLASWLGKDDPAMDDRGNAQRQRVPFVASGSYGGCPVRGFGWSEVIVNWYRYSDPWFTGGEPPEVPAPC